jgi:hypothetical protein
MRPIRPSAGWLSRNDRQMAANQPMNDDEIYTGSILFVPVDGDNCWQRLLDNQTGRLWDNGFVSCETAAPHSLISQPGRYSTAGRVDAIRKGFLGRGK